MIKINKSLAELDGIAKNHYQLILAKPFLIKDVLKNKYEHPVNNEAETFFKALHDDIENIIIGRPSDLEAKKVNLSRLYVIYMNTQLVGINDPKQISKKKIEVKEEILKIFNYSKFIKYDKNKFAYDLAKKLDVRVCLYCNRQYTFTLLTKSGKTRPQFDHFYDKATYPFFALSFYNLVASCSICNSSLKGTEAFNINDNIHPYIDSIENSVKFSIGVTASDFIEGKTKSFNVKTEPTQNSNAQFVDRVEKNMQAFKIIDLYNEHKDYVSEIIKKAYYYNETKITELINIKIGNTNKPLFNSKDEIYEFILCNYIKEKDYTKRVLSKLTRDIAVELNLIKTQ